MLFRAVPESYGSSQARRWVGAIAAGLHYCSQQRGIWAASATCTTAHGNVGSLTHWLRPGIKPTSSWILVGFVSSEPWRELLSYYLLTAYLIGALNNYPLIVSSIFQCRWCVYIYIYMYIYIYICICIYSRALKFQEVSWTVRSRMRMQSRNVRCRDQNSSSVHDLMIWKLSVSIPISTVWLLSFITVVKGQRIPSVWFFHSFVLLKILGRYNTYKENGLLQGLVAQIVI